MMIDTIRVVIQVNVGRPLFGGRMVSTKWEDGQEQREFELLKHMKCEGSWSGSMMLRCIDGYELELYGSPTKFLHGHNLFGSSDLFALLKATIQRLQLGPLADVRVSDVAISEAKIQRIDVNEMFTLRNLEDVKLYIKAAASRASLSHRGKGALAEDGCTVSWGMHRGNRSAWKIKIYAKGPEFVVKRKGKLSQAAPLVRSELLKAWVDRQIRVEIEVHGRELDKLGIRSVDAWDAATAAKLWDAKASKLFWGDEPMEIEENKLEAPGRVTALYDSWLAGRDLAAHASRRSFFRWRSEVKKHYGVDIALPAPESGMDNVKAFTFRRVLQVERADQAEIEPLVRRLLAA
ncbi:phage/plasmid replication protein, II/X family [Sandaracinobacter sp. RS1-74]|uniref:phage/plasmid replication protein, II/X family n=1 Tax=Sandaracinobacteroides sayramensis TaxID=2913411 RepID=UPI001EDA4E01|nr:phage/plasmid replication protein, II/X family [Sandaracinobacteroides sayramensis]MCG2841914.1 phage/plasmid replication protein, II/X family [Sandaracinobacteroides sayramensis]